ncbi:hypothetical protein H0X06_01595 [Candidatus Dependentiae bacterium]|nr:hypothetical protein [Candidatus Dependentiae bacterium]
MNFKTTVFAALIPIFIANGMQKPLPFQNMGASCFINSALQPVSAMKKLTDLLVDYKDMYKPDSLASTYVQLLTKSIQEKKLDSNLLENFCFKSWDALNVNPYSQQDSGEMLHEILQHISYGDIKEEISRDFKKDTSGQPITELSELYSLKISTQTVIPQKNYKGKIEYTSQLMLNLSIQPMDQTLNQCIEEYFKTADVEYTFSGGETTIAQKTTSLENLGEYLILHLKRTTQKYDPIKQQLADPVRNENPLRFPIENLNLDPYFTNPSTGKGNYDLLAFIMHSGGVSAGHYIAYTRFGAQWYRADDSTITPVSTATIQEIANKGLDTYQNRMPTTFIYEKKSSSSLPSKPSLSSEKPLIEKPVPLVTNQPISVTPQKTIVPEQKTSLQPPSITSSSLVPQQSYPVQHYSIPQPQQTYYPTPQQYGVVQPSQTYYSAQPQQGTPYRATPPQSYPVQQHYSIPQPQQTYYPTPQQYGVVQPQSPSYYTTQPAQGTSYRATPQQLYPVQQPYSITQPQQTYYPTQYPVMQPSQGTLQQRASMGLREAVQGKKGS